MALKTPLGPRLALSTPAYPSTSALRFFVVGGCATGSSASAPALVVLVVVVVVVVVVLVLATCTGRFVVPQS